MVFGKPGVRTMEEPEDVMAPPIDSDQTDTDEPDPHHDSAHDEPAQKPGAVTRQNQTNLTVDGLATPQQRSTRSAKKRAAEKCDYPDSDEQDISQRKKAKTINSPNSSLFGSLIGDGFLVDGNIKPPKRGYGKKTGCGKQGRRAMKPTSTSPDPMPRRNHERTKSMLKSVSPQQLSIDGEISESPRFKLPEGYDDLISATEPPRITMPLQMNTMAGENANLDQARCSVCSKPVDKHSKGMSIAQQRQVFRQHKEKCAREQWEAKNYPMVDWAHLDSRIGTHRAFLESLINGTESYFGKQLRKDIRTGKNRTLFTTDDYPLPGYYGLKGMSTITEKITEIFSSLLRERTPHDRLISARGCTHYVQFVLVPELGVRLIKEDMGISDDNEARKVMRESRAVGVILNDDV